jgi:hypothetical protein
MQQWPSLESHEPYLCFPKKDATVEPVRTCVLSPCLLTSHLPWPGTVTFPQPQPAPARSWAGPPGLANGSYLCLSLQSQVEVGIETREHYCLGLTWAC